MNDNIITPDVKAKITWMNDDPAAPKKAAATITIGNCFIVHGLGIVEGPSGLFISMPQRTVERNGEKKFNKIAHPITSDMRKAIHDAVFTAYSQAMAISKQYKDSITNQKIPEDQVENNSPQSDSDDGDQEKIFSSDEDSESEEDTEEDFAPIMGQIM